VALFESVFPDRDQERAGEDEEAAGDGGGVEAFAEEEPGDDDAEHGDEVVRECGLGGVEAREDGEEDDHRHAVLENGEEQEAGPAASGELGKLREAFGFGEERGGDEEKAREDVAAQEHFERGEAQEHFLGVDVVEGAAEDTEEDHEIAGEVAAGTEVGGAQILAGGDENARDREREAKPTEAGHALAEEEERHERGGDGEREGDERGVGGEGALGSPRGEKLGDDLAAETDGEEAESVGGADGGGWRFASGATALEEDDGGEQERREEQSGRPL